MQNRHAFRSNDADRNDVKYTIFTLYEIINPCPSLSRRKLPHELDASMVTGIKTWEQHMDVRLGANVAEYQRMLEDWVDDATGKMVGGGYVAELGGDSEPGMEHDDRGE